MERRNPTGNDYIVIKAKEDGVNVIGLTRGSDTRFHHSEKLDHGEVLIAQFTEHTSAIKIIKAFASIFSISYIKNYIFAKYIIRK